MAIISLNLITSPFKIDFFASTLLYACMIAVIPCALVYAVKGSIFEKLAGETVTKKIYTFYVGLGGE